MVRERAAAEATAAACPCCRAAGWRREEGRSPTSRLPKAKSPWPVIEPAASLHSHRTVAATSCGWMKLALRVGCGERLARASATVRPVVHRSAARTLQHVRTRRSPGRWYSRSRQTSRSRLSPVRASTRRRRAWPRHRRHVRIAFQPSAVEAKKTIRPDGVWPCRTSKAGFTLVAERSGQVGRRCAASRRGRAMGRAVPPCRRWHDDIEGAARRFPASA